MVGGVNFVLGGLSKLSLYRTHLLTLTNMINVLEGAVDKPDGKCVLEKSFLVALATGSGKTFVQALLLLAFKDAGISGVFALPDNLIEQFKLDLKRLLPENLVDDVKTVREHLAVSDNGQDAVFKGANIIVGSHNALLQRHYNNLLALDPDKVVFVSDEHSKAIVIERAHIKIDVLREKLFMVMLTATPPKTTYDRSVVVAINSAKSKQKAWQGSFPEVFTLEAKDVRDKQRYIESKGRELSFSNKAGLLLADNMSPPASSAAITLLTEIKACEYNKPRNHPTYYNGQNTAKQKRWNTVKPGLSKALVLVSDKNEIANVAHILQDKKRHNAYYLKVYDGGNFTDRSNIFNLFQLDNADDEVNEQFNDVLEIQSGYEAEINSMSQVIYHNIVDLFLRRVLGLSQEKLEQMRLTDTFPDGCFEQVKAANIDDLFGSYLRYSKASNPKGIDEEGAVSVLAIIKKVRKYCVSLNTADFLSFLGNDPSQEVQGYYLKCAVKDFAKKYGVIFLHKGVGQDGVDKPYRMEQKELDVYDETTGKSNKDGKLTSMEVLDHTSKITKFIPKYFPFSEEVADNYFKLGLIAFYVTNKKGEGFSDLSLSTVAVIVGGYTDPENKPANLVQAVGRLRGLGSTTPCFFLSHGKGVSPGFDLEKLVKLDDYYPELFRAEVSFQKKFIENLGLILADKLTKQALLHENADGVVDDANFFRHDLLSCILEIFRDINNQNEHDVELSKHMLSQVVAVAKKQLLNEIDCLEEPVKLSLFMQGLGSFLSGISGFVRSFYFFSESVKSIFYNIEDAGSSQEYSADVVEDSKLYLKIINRLSLGEVFKSVGVLGRSLAQFKQIGSKLKALSEPLNQDVRWRFQAQQEHRVCLVEQSLCEMTGDISRLAVGAKVKGFVFSYIGLSFDDLDSGVYSFKQLKATVQRLNKTSLLAWIKTIESDVLGAIEKAGTDSCLGSEAKNEIDLFTRNCKLQVNKLYHETVKSYLGDRHVETGLESKEEHVEKGLEKTIKSKISDLRSKITDDFKKVIIAEAQKKVNSLEFKGVDEDFLSAIKKSSNSCLQDIINVSDSNADIESVFGEGLVQGVTLFCSDKLKSQLDFKLLEKITPAIERVLWAVSSNPAVDIQALFLLELSADGLTTDELGILGSNPSLFQEVMKPVMGFYQNYMAEYKNSIAEIMRFINDESSGFARAIATHMDNLTRGIEKEIEGLFSDSEGPNEEPPAFNTKEKQLVNGIVQLGSKVTPLLFCDAFRLNALTLVEFLSENDIKRIILVRKIDSQVSVFQRQESVADNLARDVYNLIRMLKKQSFKQIEKKFLVCNGFVDGGFDIPFERIFRALQACVGEVAASVLFFNNSTEKGIVGFRSFAQGSGVEGLLSRNLALLPSIEGNTKSTRSILVELCLQFKYIKEGLVNGNDDANELLAVSNRGLKKLLEEIVSEILTPFGAGLFSDCSPQYGDVKQSDIARRGLGLLDALLSRDLGNAVKKAEALTTVDVKEIHCPKDTVERLEERLAVPNPVGDSSSYRNGVAIDFFMALGFLLLLAAIGAGLSFTVLGNFLSLLSQKFALDAVSIWLSQLSFPFVVVVNSASFVVAGGVLLLLFYGAKKAFSADCLQCKSVPDAKVPSTSLGGSQPHNRKHAGTGAAPGSEFSCHRTLWFNCI